MKKHFKKLLPILLLLVSLIAALPFLTSCSLSPEIPDVNPSTIVNLLFPNPIVFLAQVIATIILILVVLKFVWKPYNQMLEKRKNYVMKEITEIDEKKKVIFEQESLTKQAYLEAQTRSQEMIEQATEKSNLIISESKIEAQNNYDNIIKEAHNEVEIWKQKIQKEIQDQNVELVLTAAEELTMKNIKDADNKKFVEDFLKKLDKEL